MTLPRLVLLFCALSMLDLALTISLLTIAQGNVVEVNPVANYVLQETGFFGLSVFKVLMVLLVVGVCFLISLRQPSVSRRVMFFACCVTTLIVSYSIGRLCRLLAT